MNNNLRISDLTTKHWPLKLLCLSEDTFIDSRSSFAHRIAVKVQSFWEPHRVETLWFPANILHLMLSYSAKQPIDGRKFVRAEKCRVREIRKRMMKYVWLDLWSVTYGKAMNNRWVTLRIDLSVYLGFLLKEASSWIWYYGCKIKPILISSTSIYSCSLEHGFLQGELL